MESVFCVKEVWRSQLIYFCISSASNTWSWGSWNGVQENTDRVCWLFPSMCLNLTLWWFLPNRDLAAVLSAFDTAVILDYCSPMLCQFMPSTFWKLEVASVHHSFLGEKICFAVIQAPLCLWISRHLWNIGYFFPICPAASEVAERKIVPVKSSSDNPALANLWCLQGVYSMSSHGFYMVLEDHCS